MTDFEALPDAIKKGSHWRVSFRPTHYDPFLLPSLKDCWDTVRKTRVRLRGWDYPHVGTRPEDRSQGENWIASGLEWERHHEYWRFFQSGQFVHLFQSWEQRDDEWQEKLRNAARSTILVDNVDWSSVRSFLSRGSFIYTMTEVFEFASRLAQHCTYEGAVGVTIELNRMNGFVLVSADAGTVFQGYHRLTTNRLGNEWRIPADELVADSVQYSLRALQWFFERFDWSDPPIEEIAGEQTKFLAGRL